MRARRTGPGLPIACVWALTWAPALGSLGQERAAQATSLVTVSAGRFDANRRRDTAVELGLQLRLGPPGRLQPMVGGMLTSDETGFMYGGASADLGGRQLVLRPSFAAGLYRRGQGKDLGGALEFRSGLELGWRVDSGLRVGLELYHLSNAGIGHGNPGQETLALTLSLPLGRRGPSSGGREVPAGSTARRE